ncbi:MAG: hypothetical protein HY272_09270 [Gammaproteobacteria bacterium]|nr:hypothetical protein [Gammaproteobacteria bacterium]
MIRLPESRNAWSTPEFNSVLTREVEALPVDQLPLQQGLSVSSYVVDDKPSVRIISVADTADVIRAKIGVFYRGMIAGCNCADDPTPMEALNEYCELWLVLNKRSGEAVVSLVDQNE